ncbi:MAG: hypothetical protein JWM80_3396 [Cyanobacteria bacterium RYN_339]|nr:hypothetical protein [Cyanobacteria bacterium RYN_339]
MSIESLGAKLIEKALPRASKRPVQEVVAKLAPDLLALDRKAIARLDHRSAVDIIAKLNARLRKLDPEALTTKYEHMAKNPRRFFTGQPELMAYDLRELARKLKGRTIVQGDMHLRNFGTMVDAKGGLGVLLNDFDDAAIGPGAVDFNRLATATVLSGRELGLTTAQTQELVKSLGGAYYDTLGAIAHGAGGQPVAPKQILSLLEKARKVDPVAWLEQQAPKVNGKRLLLRNEGQLEVSTKVAGGVKKALGSYQKQLGAALEGYQVTDVVKVVSGTGSIGQPRFLALLERGAGDEPVILQLKGQAAAPLARFHLPGPKFSSQAERNVKLGQLLDDGLDPYRGTAPGNLLVERVRPVDGGLEIPDLKQAEDFQAVIKYYAATAAKAHANGAKLGLATAQEILDTLGPKPSFVDGLVNFAHQYADQTERDHAAFVKALATNPLLVK